jgi:beta-mannosidase
MWAYRQDVSRFPNEGGVLGVSSPATLRQFMPEDQRYLFSPIWEFHENGCNYRRSKGITYQFVEHWLGKTEDELGFEDYCFHSAILQSEGLQEYANNFRRRMFSTSSAIFWMYNDSWPATHGWTIVDYYLRRKLAYHPVRRAFEPIYVIPVVEGERVIIFGVNDTLQPWQGEARFGLFRLAGGLPVDSTLPVTLAPNGATVIGEMPLAEWKSLGTDSAGAFAVLLKDSRPVAQNRIFIEPFKNLKFAEPRIKVERRGDKAVLSSSSFVWAVCLDINGESPISDDVFDLLPGIEYMVPWPADKPLPEVQRCASPLPRP